MYDFWNRTAISLFDAPSNGMSKRIVSLKGSLYRPETHDKLLNGLRQLVLRMYRINLWRSFKPYIIQKHGEVVWKKYILGENQIKRSSTKEGVEFGRDLEVGQEALRQVYAASWWEWIEGSSLLFWKWQKSHILEERDGSKI